MPGCHGDGAVTGWRADGGELNQPMIVVTVEMKTQQAAGADGKSESGDGGLDRR